MHSALKHWARALVSWLAASLERIGIATPFVTAETLLELSRGFEIVRLGGRHDGYDGLTNRMESVILSARQIS